MLVASRQGLLYLRTCTADFLMVFAKVGMNFILRSISSVIFGRTLHPIPFWKRILIMFAIVKKFGQKNFLGVLECPKIDLDNAKFTSFFDIIPANLIVVTFPILLKKRIFITGVFGKKSLEIFYFVGRGPQKTNTQKWFFLHISLNNSRV